MGTPASDGVPGPSSTRTPGNERKVLELMEKRDKGGEVREIQMRDKTRDRQKGHDLKMKMARGEKRREEGEENGE